MENTHNHQHEQRPDSRYAASEVFGEDCIPIVRGNTPKLPSSAPRSQAGQAGQSHAAFPVEAPSAPPLPEEYGDRLEPTHTLLSLEDTTPLPVLPSAPAKQSPEPSSEFVWLFEYGIEMDSALLNSADRLDGLALLYGPAVLKGYRLTFDALNGRTSERVAGIVPGRNLQSEVWGLLYRVPCRFIEERQQNENPLLDTIHGARFPNDTFERVEITVYDPYRNREVTCIAYSPSLLAQHLFHLTSEEQRVPDPLYMQRLVAIARKQKFPLTYIAHLEEMFVPLITRDQQKYKGTGVSTMVDEEAKLPVPPVAIEQQKIAAKENNASVIETEMHSSPGMMMFAIYVVFVLLAVLILGVFQGLGFGRDVFTAQFAPFGAPWFVLAYGLIGGCVSCLITSGRPSVKLPPPFMLVTWFARPYLGVILAMLAYLLLNTGLFVIGGNVEQHTIFFSLLAFLVGCCESRLFRRLHVF